LTLPADLPVDWLEVGDESGDAVLPAGQRVVEGWRRSERAISTATVRGDPFWTLQETTLVPALLSATTAVVRSWAR
jgi:hypothetical protein